MTKKCLSNKEFQEVLELLGKQVFRNGAIHYVDYSKRYHYALFVYFPEYSEKVIDVMADKFGRNIDFETVHVPNKDFSKSEIEEYTEIYKLNNRFTITEQTPILELKVRGYINEYK